MKQFNLEIILKRSKHCYKKPQPKLVKFSARVLASCATKQPPLGSILGTNGINAEMFCQKFNASTANYTPIIVPVSVTIQANKSYTYDVMLPTAYTLFNLIKQRLKKLRRKLYRKGLLILLYKMAMIKDTKVFKAILKSTYSWDLFRVGKQKEDRNPHAHRRKKKK
jgi:ribosomal protein L11